MVSDRMGHTLSIGGLWNVFMLLTEINLSTSEGMHSPVGIPRGDNVASQL